MLPSDVHDRGLSHREAFDKHTDCTDIVLELQAVAKVSRR